MRKRKRSRDVSPLFKQQTRTAQDRDRARTLKVLLEANAKWNAERRRLAGHDLQQLVDDTSTINPDLRKQLLYSWERGFVKNESTVSVKAIRTYYAGTSTKKVGAEMTTVTTISGSLYRK